MSTRTYLLIRDNRRVGTLMSEELELHSVQDWYDGMKCTETALCAVTSLPPGKIIAALEQSILADGCQLDPTGAVNIKHWMAALDVRGIKCEPSDDGGRPITIEQFMSSNDYPFPILVVAEDGKLGHVFAVQEKNLVDVYTRGKVQEFKEAPPDMKQFRVKRLVYIEKKI
jgi:hypothetical protein